MENLSSLAGQATATLLDAGTGETLGQGLVNRAGTIVIRKFDLSSIKTAFIKREKYFKNVNTENKIAVSSFTDRNLRMVSGDFDGKPGLFVEKVGESFYIRTETLGATRWLDESKQTINEKYPNADIHEEVRVQKKERVIGEDRHYWPFETTYAREKFVNMKFKQAGKFLEVGHHFGEHTRILAELYEQAEFTVVAESKVEGLPKNAVFMQPDSIHKEIEEMAEARMKFDYIMYQASQPLVRDKSLKFGEFGKNFRPSEKGIEGALVNLMKIMNPGGMLSFTMILPLGRHGEASSLLMKASDTSRRDVHVVWRSTGVNLDCGALVANLDKYVPITIVCSCM